MFEMSKKKKLGLDDLYKLKEAYRHFGSMHDFVLVIDELISVREAQLNKNDAFPEITLPEGWKLVPEQMYLDADDIESICDRCGNGDEQYGEFTDCILWVGELSNDGVMKYGLNVACADYPDEGSITVCEFDPPIIKGDAPQGA
jgi:hypothetical protein